MKGCLLLLIAIPLLVLGGCTAYFVATDDTDEWCASMDSFYAENPYDSNEGLANEYAARC